MTKIIVSIIVISVLLIIFVPNVSALFKKMMNNSGEGLLAQIVSFFNKRKPEVIEEFKKETREMKGDIVKAGEIIVEKWQWVRGLAK